MVGLLLQAPREGWALQVVFYWLLFSVRLISAA